MRFVPRRPFRPSACRVQVQILMNARLPWLVIAAKSDARDTASLPKPFRPRSREGTCDLETAHLWALSRSSPEQIVPIVREQDRPWWRKIIAGVPATNVVEEPLDRGSAPGVLVASLRLSRWDPRGRIALVSTDRRRPWPTVFERVEALLDEPDPTGIKVDGKIAVGPIQAFLELFSRCQPRLFLTFCKRPNAVWDLASTYPFIDHTDVWTEVLAAPTPTGFRLTEGRPRATAPA